jgi:hypothetical protein
LREIVTFTALEFEIGIYINWWATCFANNFVPSEAPPMRALNTAFQLGLLIALLYQGTHIHAIEAYILISIRFGDISVSTVLLMLYLDRRVPKHHFRPPKLRYHYEHVTFIGIFLRLISAIIFDGYSAYYWFSGIDKMARSPCPTWGFFLVRVDLFGWLRTFNKVVSIGQCILGPFCFFYFSQRIQQVLTGNKLTAVFFFVFHQGHEEDQFPRWISTVIPLLNIVLISLVMLTTELTIRWNKVFDVDQITSAGQLIPTIVSICGFCKVLYSFGGNTGSQSLTLTSLSSPPISPSLPEQRADVGMKDWYGGDVMH